MNWLNLRVSKIDSYDFVMRSNLPQTKGYEMYVGSKTSVNLCYWSSAKRAAESGRELNNTHLIYGGELILLFIFS